MGSADLMPRNLDRRIEVLAPILDPALRERVSREVLKPHIEDTRVYRLQADGSYTPPDSPKGEQGGVQYRMLERFGCLAE